MTTALFMLTTSTGHKAIVRAACAQCARNKAVEAAGEEGTLVWREASVEHLDPINGKRGVIGKWQG